MAKNAKYPIRIDLNEFKLHVDLKNKIGLTLHFNSPSRMFYLSLIAFVVNEMKRRGKIIPIPMEEHLDLLALLNESIGGAAGSSERKNLLPRIYRKWHLALANLEEAPLFKILGRKKEYDGGIGKSYQFTEAEKDYWANLFEYKGSEENVRLKLAIDKLGLSLDDVVIIYGGSLNAEAWDQFISSLKNVRQEGLEPVEETAVPESPADPISPPQERKISWLFKYRWVIAVVVIGIVAGAIWKVYWSPAPLEMPSREKMAFPLPDKPSIAVLPFVNMSDDPKQEFLGDGITENIITALSKVPRLFVISRQSTFFYKGKPVKAKQVSEELGVRYVLEGSVQRSADRIRISVQLIDAFTGHHLWGGRYDRDLQDLFALQDEITIKILTATRMKLTDGEHTSMTEKSYEKYYKGKQGLDCYLKLMEGIGYVQRWNIEDNNLGRRLIEEALAMCPENPVGYINLSWAYHHEYLLDNTKPPRETIEKSMELAQKALALDDSIAGAHALLCQLHSTRGEYDKAIAEGERAVGLNPGDTSALSEYAWVLNHTGRSEEAIPLFQKVIRLNPFGKSTLYRGLGTALRNTGRLEEAVSAFKKAIQGSPNDIISHLGLAATYSMMGREKEARAEAAEVLRINPKFSLDSYAKRLPPPTDQSRRDEHINTLRKTGLK